jgi:hypothetical protein
MNIIGSIVRIASTVISDLAGGGKAVDATIEGSGENTATAQVYGPHGIITRPAERTTGVRLRIGRRSIIVAVVNYGVDPPENPGETKVYSTDQAGTEQASHVLTNDGKHVFNNGEDWAVRFSELETAFNQLKDDYDSLVTTFNTHAHAGVSTGGGTSGPPTATGAASTADISGAKVEEVQLP